MKKLICSHPELIPNQWEQKRPEPSEMISCGCGANVSCPVCGYGWGTYPHTDEECHKRAFNNRLTESIEKYRDIWQELAKR